MTYRDRMRGITRHVAEAIAHRDKLTPCQHRDLERRLEERERERATERKQEEKPK